MDRLIVPICAIVTSAIIGADFRFPCVSPNKPNSLDILDGSSVRAELVISCESVYILD